MKTKQPFATILLACLFVLFYGRLDVLAQDSDKSLSVGVHYSYAGTSQSTRIASGAGINAIQQITGSLSIGVSSSYYFPTYHEISGFNTYIEIRKRALVSSLYGRFEPFDSKLISVYGTVGVIHYWSHNKGLYSVYDDVGGEQYNSITEIKKFNYTPQFGLGLETTFRINLFAEAILTSMDSSTVLLLSGGLRLVL